VKADAVRPWLAALLLAPAACLAGGPPLDEIRQALARDGLDPPAPAVLQALEPGDLAAGLRRIDPHARWFPAGDLARDAAPSEGVGVGAALARWGDRLVLAPYAEGALARRGLTAPFAVATVDGAAVSTLSLAEAGRRLAGAPGSAVRLGIAAGPGAPAREVTVVREPYRALAVEPAVEGGYPVVRVRGFATRETRTLLAFALEGMAAVPGPLVLDLRDCPGGDLFEALDSAALFLPEGAPLGETRDARGERRAYVAPGGPKPARPRALVLWVGPGTASAGEVFAGVLRHHGVARLVGERTYGKCSSQTDRTLSDGSVLRLTNREVILPDGRSCSGAGIEPDVGVGGEGLLDGPALLRASLAAVDRPAGR
jgi:carboxyl-terminal processing protease